MRTRMEVIKNVAEQYRRSTRKEKGKILDSIVRITGYNRSYASHLLSLCGKGYRIKARDGKEYRLVADPRVKPSRKRQKTYGPEVLEPLKYIWTVMDFPCGKRLAACMEWLVPKLEECGELNVAPEVKEKLLSISPSTIDRMLASERKTLTIKRRSLTKPGTLLKHQIPVRTFAQWDDARPGFEEVDLVDHGGGSTQGEYAFTLNVTDVSTGWTEMRAVKNRAQKWVFEALNLIRRRLPFPLLGIDSDNDSAFINDHLIRFCQQNHITFTRSRAGKKNDNCYVEQKNWSVIRKVVGYNRYDTETELNLLNRIYDILRLYQNFFQPSVKLISKERVGSNVIKRYDKPATPYQRILASEYVDQNVKNQLRDIFARLNPVDLKRKITALQKKLALYSASKGNAAENLSTEDSAAFV